jgi:hypothetical protein
MARIQASEHLQLISVYAVGGGNLKRSDSTRVINELQRAAQGGAARRRVKPTAQQLAAVGIKVEIVKKEVEDNS